MLDKLVQVAERLIKASSTLASYVDRESEVTERGVTIAFTAKEFFANKWRHIISDASGHRDVIKNSYDEPRKRGMTTTFAKKEIVKDRLTLVSPQSG